MRRGDDEGQAAPSHALIRLPPVSGRVWLAQPRSNAAQIPFARTPGLRAFRSVSCRASPSISAGS